MENPKDKEVINHMQRAHHRASLRVAVDRGVAAIIADFYNKTKRSIMHHRRSQFMASAAVIRVFPEPRITSEKMGLDLAR